MLSSGKSCALTRKKRNMMQKLGLKSLFEITYITIGVTATFVFIRYTLIQSEPQDFRVFYDSAQAALSGGMIYNTYGPIHLPYWYFPWLAWFYIPFAFFSREVAYTIYTAISILCALTSVYFLAKKAAPDISLLDRLFMFCMTLLLCWLLFRVGQMDLILLAITVFTIYLIDSKKPFLAGLSTPILLFKPHLFIVFFPFATLKGGKRFFISAVTTTLALLVISFVVIPDWPLQMLRLLAASGQRTDNNWNFTTLPNLLGLQENWSGTANLPFTIVLILMGLVAVWSVRALPTLPLLSIALAGSLFCAPRAYSYNFPLLVPALIWLSANLPKPFFLLFWSVIGILPFLFRFSTGTYSIVLAAFIMGTVKALRQREGTPLPLNVS